MPGEDPRKWAPPCVPVRTYVSVRVRMRMQEEGGRERESRQESKGVREGGGETNRQGDIRHGPLSPCVP